ncbi:triadin-like isoform X2 [Mytilus edulis]|uniref:triadin-like isoform X2 n=1 Tax=Mytilus edulis TaxID=6550 RepID=UPI0039EE173C
MEEENKSPRQVTIKTPEGDHKSSKNNEDEYEDTDADTDKEGESSRPQSMRIDLTRVRSAYSARTHKESNLPSVLTDYGMEDDKTKEKGRRKKKKIRSEKENDHDMDGNTEKRKKKREEIVYRSSSERYQQIMENQEDGGNFYSKKVSGLALRVKTQSDSRSQTPRTPRTPRQEEEETKQVPNVLEKQIPEKKSQKNCMKKKLKRHELSTNTDFLKTVPKTETAKIIELQDKLMKEGKLKTQAEVDRFWQDIKKPDVYSSYFKPAMQTQASGSGSATSSLNRSNVESHSTVAALQDYPGRSLSQISERSSVPGLYKDTQDWAITQQFKHQHSSHTKVASPVKSRTTDLEKKFPKTQMPQLHCFTMDLGEKPPDPEQLAREAELKVKIKQRKRFLRKLHRMHQMAMANNAATNRILDKHGELSSFLEGNTLRDVKSLYCGMQTNLLSILPAPEDQYISEEDLRMPESVYPALPPPRASVSQGSSKPRSLVSRESRTSLASRGSFRKESSRRKLGKELPPPPPPIPLTLEEIRQKTRVIEPKCLSTNWINYMRNGRPVQSES